MIADDEPKPTISGVLLHGSWTARWEIRLRSDRDALYSTITSNHTSPSDTSSQSSARLLENSWSFSYRLSGDDLARFENRGQVSCSSFVNAQAYGIYA